MFKFSLLLNILGISFLILESIFYQDIDKSGKLSESLFMPIGIILLLAGVGLLLIIGVKKLILKYYNNRNINKF